MNRFFVLGLFALLIVIISLLRLSSEREFFRLTTMKKVWGRRRGLAIHFLSNVGLPLVIGIVFLSHGVAGFSSRVPEESTWQKRRLDLQAISLDYASRVRVAARERHPSLDTGLCP